MSKIYIIQFRLHILMELYASIPRIRTIHITQTRYQHPIISLRPGLTKPKESAYVPAICIILIPNAHSAEIKKKTQYHKESFYLARQIET